MKYDFQDKSSVINNKTTEGNMTKINHKENREIFGDTELEFVYGEIKFNHAEQKKTKDFKPVDSDVYPKTMTYKKFVKWLADNNRPYKLILVKENLKNSDIACIDFDGEHHTKEYLKETYPFLSSTQVLPGNTKGYHYFVRNNIFENFNSKLVQQFPEDREIDLLSNYIWLKPTDWAKYKSNLDMIGEIELDDLDKISTVIRDRCKYQDDLSPELLDKLYSSIHDDEIIELVNILSSKTAENGQDWSLMIAALKKLGLKDLAREFTKKSKKHNMTDYEFENKWSSSNELDEPIRLIMSRARDGNPIEYKKIRDKYKYAGLCLDIADFDTSDKLCDKIFVYLQGKLVFDGSSWWSPINNLWTIIKKPTRDICCLLTAGWKYSDKKLSEKLYNIDDDKERKKIEDDRDMLKNLRKKYDSQSGVSILADQLTKLLLDKDFVNKLDKFKYKIPFKNGIYDLKTNYFRHEIFDSDFITKTSHVEYDESYDEQKLRDDTTKVESELLKIFNNDKKFYDFVLSYIGCAFCSVPDVNQTCLFNIGVGSNGKTKLVELLSEIFPNMVSTAGSELLQCKFDKPHKYLPILGEYSLIYFEEFPDGKVNDELFKHVVGGKKINTTKMYETNQTIRLKSKLIINSNNRPVFHKMADNIVRRFYGTEYKSKFNYKYKDDPDNLKFKANEDWGTDMLNYTQAIIRLVIKYGSEFAETGELYELPKTQQEYTNSIIQDNDEIGTWFRENIKQNTGTELSLTEIMYEFNQDCDEPTDRKKIRDFMKKKYGNTCYDSRGSCRNSQGKFENFIFTNADKNLTHGVIAVVVK
jgi:phage/plasmid-associated DNA primase